MCPIRFFAHIPYILDRIFELLDWQDREALSMTSRAAYEYHKWTSKQDPVTTKKIFTEGLTEPTWEIIPSNQVVRSLHCVAHGIIILTKYSNYEWSRALPFWPGWSKREA